MQDCSLFAPITNFFLLTIMYDVLKVDGVLMVVLLGTVTSVSSSTVGITDATSTVKLARASIIGPNIHL